MKTNYTLKECENLFIKIFGKKELEKHLKKDKDFLKIYRRMFIGTLKQSNIQELKKYEVRRKNKI